MHAQVVDLRLSAKGIKPIRNGHPWIFRNALHGSVSPARLEGAVERTLFGPDALLWEHTVPAVVRDPSGVAIGWGVFNPASRLAVRMLTRSPDQIPIRSDLQRRITRAVEARAALFSSEDHTAFRLLFGEADAVPGLAADRYGDVVVAQLSGAFAWDNREVIGEMLLSATRTHGVGASFRVAVDATTLGKDGIKAKATAASSSAFRVTSEVGGSITVRENGLEWLVDPSGGQKTGHYCDQRENRAAVADAAVGARILDCFAYHGGFGLTALSRGAERVVCLDSSAPALTRLVENAAVQGTDDRVETVRGDAFELLRSGSVGAHAIETFDLIVLDPPKLVAQRRDLENGLRAYKDLNLAVFRAARSGARIATFSCSGAVSREEFRRALAWAAADARRTVVIEREFGQGPDHPVPLHFPEAEYLKGFLLRIE